MYVYAREPHAAANRMMMCLEGRTEMRVMMQAANSMLGQYT